MLKRVGQQKDWESLPDDAYRENPDEFEESMYVVFNSTMEEALNHYLDSEVLGSIDSVYDWLLELRDLIDEPDYLTVARFSDNFEYDFGPDYDYYWDMRFFREIDIDQSQEREEFEILKNLRNKMSQELIPKTDPSYFDEDEPSMYVFFNSNMDDVIRFYINSGSLESLDNTSLINWLDELIALVHSGTLEIVGMEDLQYDFGEGFEFYWDGRFFQNLDTVGEGQAEYPPRYPDLD
jgi:hypothetical protein